MSQKATFDLIEWAKRVADQSGHDGYWNLALTAKKEQQAIQKAAKDLVELWGYAGDGEEPFETIKRIAKEAP